MQGFRGFRRVGGGGTRGLPRAGGRGGAGHAKMLSPRASGLGGPGRGLFEISQNGFQKREGRGRIRTPSPYA